MLVTIANIGYDYTAAYLLCAVVTLISLIFYKFVVAKQPNADIQAKFLIAAKELLF